MSTTSTTFRTFADIVDRLGGVPLDRIRARPFPATVQDVIDIQDHEDRSCELIDGVLVDKTVGFNESRMTCYLVGLLSQYVVSNNLGVVTGVDGPMQIMPDHVRIPDGAFTSWDRFPERMRTIDPVPELVPDLAVEVLSPANTQDEMCLKRQDYFAAGVLLVWEIDIQKRTVDVYSPDGSVVTLTSAETLDGGEALPGFSLPLATYFAELDRHGKRTDSHS